MGEASMSWQPQIGTMFARTIQVQANLHSKRELDLAISFSTSLTGCWKDGGRQHPFPESKQHRRCLPSTGHVSPSKPGECERVMLGPEITGCVNVQQGHGTFRSMVTQSFRKIKVCVLVLVSGQILVKLW